MPDAHEVILTSWAPTTGGFVSSSRFPHTSTLAPAARSALQTSSAVRGMPAIPSPRGAARGVRGERGSQGRRPARCRSAQTRQSTTLRHGRASWDGVSTESQTGITAVGNTSASKGHRGGRVKARTTGSVGWMDGSCWRGIQVARGISLRSISPFWLEGKHQCQNRGGQCSPLIGRAREEIGEAFRCSASM